MHFSPTCWQMHLFLLSINQSEHQCERLLTTAQFVRSCLTFLPGNKPVHFIKHSVNLRQDQQLGQDINTKKKVSRISKGITLTASQSENQHLLLLLKQFSCWQWQNWTAFPPPHPETGKQKKSVHKCTLMWVYEGYSHQCTVGKKLGFKIVLFNLFDH